MSHSIGVRRTVEKAIPVWPIPNFFSIVDEARNPTSRRARKYRKRWDAAARDYFFSYPPSNINNCEEAKVAWDNMSKADKQVVDRARHELLEYRKWGNIATYTPDGALVTAAPSPSLMQIWALPA